MPRDFRTRTLSPVPRLDHNRSTTHHMDIFQFPPEVVLMIFEHLDPSFFRSDLSRLTVSKQWSKFTFAACYQDLHFTKRIFDRFLTSPYWRKNLSLIKDHTKSLSVCFYGYKYYPMPEDNTLGVDAENAQVWNSTRGSALSSVWTCNWDEDLFPFVTAVRQSRTLRSIRIRATHELNPLFNCLNSQPHLLQSTIHDFISVRGLTSLDLDLCAVDLEHGNREIHICATIAALLSTLRCLRLCMRTICANVLKPREGSTRLRLNSIIINLSLSNESHFLSTTAYAACCNSSLEDFPRLNADIEKQAQVLVTQMAAPKSVRIWTHELPSIRKQVYDVLTGNRMTFDKSMTWDECEVLGN